MIVDAVRKGLELKRTDLALDLCCGNGALSHKIFSYCAGGVGVDFSKYLIKIAEKDFARPPKIIFVLNNAIKYVGKPKKQKFTKIICYGAFMFFNKKEAESILRSVRKNFPSVSKIFLGNLPDLSRIKKFFRPDCYVRRIETRANTPTGIWRTTKEIQKIAKKCGWHSQIRYMPKAFSGSHYRFDAILSL